MGLYSDWNEIGKDLEGEILLKGLSQSIIKKNCLMKQLSGLKINNT